MQVALQVMIRLFWACPSGFFATIDLVAGDILLQHERIQSLKQFVRMPWNAGIYCRAIQHTSPTWLAQRT